MLPQQITVVTRATDEGFIAEIKEFPNCYTQAETFSELVEMVNDAVFTYLEIPQEYADELGTIYLPEKFFEEMKRRQIQEACRELVKDMSASSSIFRRTVLA